MTIFALAKAELKSRLRSDPIQAPLAVTLMAAGAAASAATWLIVATAKSHAPTLGVSVSWTTTSPLGKAVASNQGSAIFITMAIVSLVVAAAVAPLAGCATLNRERDPDAFEQLLQTGVRPFTVLLSKMLAAMWRTMAIVAAIAPLLTMAWFYEGAPAASIVVAGLGVLGITALGTAAGICASAIMRSSVSALLGSYLAIGAPLLLGPASVAWAWSSGSVDWIALVFTSPMGLLVASHATLWPALVGAAPAALMAALPTSADLWSGAATPYVFSGLLALADLSVAVLLLLIASIILDVLHPLRLWHANRGAAR